MVNSIILLFICIFLNVFYYLFLKFKNYDEKKGIGFFITLIPLLYLYLGGNYFTKDVYYIFFIIFIFSALYLYDDLFNLGVFSRLIIQFLSGFLIIYFNFFTIELNYQVIIFFIIFGFWNVFLTNVINFNDGNDGNVGFLILSYSLCFLFYNFQNYYYFEINLGIIIFILTFLFFNFYFKNFYFGDAGCLAFTLIYNQLLINEIFLNKNYEYIIFILPLIYLFIDVLSVVIYRIINSENLLSRNYHHLYQKLFIRYKGYYYLLPNIVFPLMIIYFNNLLMKFLIINYLILILFNFIALLILYFLIRHKLKL